MGDRRHLADRLDPVIIPVGVDGVGFRAWGDPESSNTSALGAGTIIGVRNATRSPPRGAVTECFYRPESRQCWEAVPDELGLLLRNPVDQLGLRHRPIVARALWGRDSLGASG